jgi:hypothetical protein
VNPGGDSDKLKLQYDASTALSKADAETISFTHNGLAGCPGSSQLGTGETQKLKSKKYYTSQTPFPTGTIDD